MMNSTEDSPNSALQGCLETCRRCEVLINLVLNHSDGPDIFQALSPHLGHCLDHFSCLIRGLETGVVDYDARDRSSAIENNASVLLNALHQITAELARLEGKMVTRPLEVTQLAAPGRGRHQVQSTLGRELVFLSSHTLHHLELLIEIAASKGMELPRELGMAFSTSAYLSGHQAVSA